MQSVILGGLFFFCGLNFLGKRAFVNIINVLKHQQLRTGVELQATKDAKIETKIAATRSEKWQNYTFARKSKDMTSKEF